MSGTTAPDEAARLEAALERIARAAASLPEPAPHATTPPAAVAARLDALIADLRAVLGTQV